MFPTAEQRDDCFHAHYKISKVLARLERSADAAILAEEQAKRELDAARRSDKRVTQARKTLRVAGKHCACKVSDYDDFERAAVLVREGMEIVDVRAMRLRSPVEMGTKILAGARRMQAHRREDCRKVGRYIKNRAAGLVRHTREVLAKLNSLG